MADKPFCTIEIRDVETAAYIAALIMNTNPSVSHHMESTVAAKINCGFPGGVSAAAGLKTLCGNGGRRDVLDKLEEKINQAGCTATTAPWLGVQAPTEIDGWPVTCSSDGVKVGPTKVTLEELELLVEKCKAQEDA